MTNLVNCKYGGNFSLHRQICISVFVKSMSFRVSLLQKGIMQQHPGGCAHSKYCLKCGSLFLIKGSEKQVSVPEINGLLL